MNTLDPRELRAKVQQEVTKRQTFAKRIFFASSLIFLGVFGTLGWGFALNAMNQMAIPESVSGGIIGGMVFLTAGWGVSVLYQGISLFMDSKAGAKAIRDQVAAQVIAREQLAGLMDEPESAEKPKRDEAYELTDDGEIQPADDYLSEAEIEAKRRAAR